MKPGNPSVIAQEYIKKGASRTCPIIDMHGHFGPFPAGYLPAAPMKNMIHALQRAGVKKIVCSSHEALLGDYKRGNQEMQSVINKYPELLSGYWAINPNHQGSWKQAVTDFQKTKGVVGFKFLPDYHCYTVTGINYQPALEYAEAKKLLVLVHTWGGSEFDSPRMLEKVAVKYPNATFLMGHSGYGAWEDSVRIARDLSNVYLELTAAYVCHDFSVLPYGSGTPVPLGSCLQVNGIIEFIVKKAGSKKIVFGTDLPWYSPHFAAGAILFARIDDSDRHDILHRNAERLLR
ncbi:MAG: amidohydrolase family protein [Candidatus Omnitrophota bacterium]